jgi:TonB family protein
MAVSLKLTGPTTSTGPASLKPDTSLNLDLNQPWREPLTPRRILRAGIGSVIFHVGIVILWISLPNEPGPLQTTVITPDFHKSVPLYLPKNLELTQKDPNNGKISRELDVRSMRSAPVPQAPRFHPPSPPPGPVAEAQPVRLPALETPKIEAPKIDVPVPTPSVTAAAPAPKPPTQPDKPKLAFEDIGSSQPRTPNAKSAIPMPKEVVPDPLAKSTPPGGGGAIVGDIGDSSITTPNSLHAPSPGEVKSNLQLLSDPKGVDFKPYMIQVLTVVRRNWLAILPESARLGRRGRVIVQFAIDRTGKVPKVVIAEGSGASALDLAAVAAISASDPLPQLPADYKGDQIKLQFAFSYNMPTH